MFDRLTYRHRYAKLVERIARDALTGPKDRGQFDTREPLRLQVAARSKQSVGLMMVDILALVWGEAGSAAADLLQHQGLFIFTNLLELGSIFIERD